MSSTYDDQDEDGDDLAHEGVQAFNAMTEAMRGLSTRMVALDTGLGDKVTAAERAAAKAETAAQGAREAAGHAAALARASARSAASWAALGALGAALVAGGAGYWLGHSGGRESGLADGYRAAQDEKAAASWANTPSGRLAFAMDQNGSLALLARCAGQGWQAETRQGRHVCFPMAYRDGSPNGSVTGWTLP